MSEITVAKGGKATFSCELPDNSYSGSWLQVSSLSLNSGKHRLSLEEAQVKSVTQSPEVLG